MAIQEVCAICITIIRKKSIALNVNVVPEVDSVELDLPKFKQILFDLLSNAIKFTDDGDTVEIRAAIHDTEHFKLVVDDTGAGISAEDLPRLFKDFAQLGPDPTRPYSEGTGLGLALVRKIIQAQGGKVSVESEVGMGSSFTVVLPYKCVIP